MRLREIIELNQKYDVRDIVFKNNGDFSIGFNSTEIALSPLDLGSYLNFLIVDNIVVDDKSVVITDGKGFFEVSGNFKKMIKSKKDLTNYKIKSFESFDSYQRASIWDKDKQRFIPVPYGDEYSPLHGELVTVEYRYGDDEIEEECFLF